MSQDRSFIFWTRLSAVAFVTTGPLLHAGTPPAPSDGYKIVPVTIGGRTVPVKVRDESDPFKAVSSSTSTGKYDPERIFSTESTMANKSFSLPSDSLSKSSSDLKNRDQDAFLTKAYANDATTPPVPNLDTKVSFPATSAYSRSATGFDKNYPVSNPDAGASHAALLASATSTDQNRTALLNAQAISTPASTLGEKKFQGPEAEAVHHHLTRMDDGSMLITELPNRPLTIDEVRNLINHGFKPNTDVKPEEPPSKPLNDPDYKPEPLRDVPAPAPVSDEDKNDPVPPPGTMAVPENSEPLPQP